jgi:transposase InsO family protein
VLARRLPLLGMSLGTFHRWRVWLGERARRQSPETKGMMQDPRRVKWVKEIMAVKYSRHKGVAKLSTKYALVEAAAQGRVPPEALEVPLGVINNIARQEGLVETPRRGARFEAAGPNFLHQVDATGSRHFFPYKNVGDDWILRLRPGQLPNKEKYEGLRVWCWGLADDFSGFRVQRYCVAPGEAALDGIDFLKWAWTPQAAHAPFEGLPQLLYLDNGALAKYAPFRVFCEEAGVDLRTHEPYRPQAKGKVETGFKDLKNDFEGRFMRDPGWKTREITLAELNQELAWFRQETNRTAHRRLPLTKEQAWLRIMLAGGPARLTPESWERIFTQNLFRTLDDAGCFSLGGAVYQVADRQLWACRVQVFVSVTGDQVMVEDLRDGTRYAAAPFAPAPAGEWRASPKTALEKARAEVEETQAGKPAAPTTWKPEEKAGGALLHLVKAGEVREVSDQLAVISDQFAEDRRPQTENLSLAELAAGITLIQEPGVGGQGPGERLFATPLERYEHLVAQEAREEALTAADREFLAWFKGEYRDFLAAAGPERAALRLV